VTGYNASQFYTLSLDTVRRKGRLYRNLDCSDLYNSFDHVSIGNQQTLIPSTTFTYNDWTQPVIDQATGAISLQLRAERSGSGNSRIYTILIKATDQSGDSSTADVNIVVPHEQRKK
jgi:hypothetical protein